VAHEDHRAGPARERGRDRRPRRWIEVVGGLVEQDQVAAAGDELRDGELRLLSARERARVAEGDLSRQTEHPEQRPKVLVVRVGFRPQVRQDGLAFPDALVLLRVVPRGDAGAEADRSPVRRRRARQDPQERGLPRSVQAHDQQPLAAGDLNRHVVEHRRPAVGRRQTLAAQDDVAGTRRLRETKGDPPLLLRRRHGDALEALDARVERLRLPRALRRRSSHRIRERLQPTDLCVLALGERREPDLVETSCLAVLRVRASVRHHAVAIEMQDPGDRSVQQREVVADDDEAALVAGQEPQEPVARVDVEVVGRFVE
jgi:hypothetical protein